jgi:hypothetical protein
MFNMMTFFMVLAAAYWRIGARLAVARGRKTSAARMRRQARHCDALARFMEGENLFPWPARDRKLRFGR